VECGKDEPAGTEVRSGGRGRETRAVIPPKGAHLESATWHRLRTTTSRWTMLTSHLPSPFQDLEHLVEEWAIATTSARVEKRLQSTIEHLGSFYRQLAPRADAVLTYLKTVALADISTHDANLLRLMLTLAEVSPAIEWYGRPDGAVGLDSRRMKLVTEFRRV
jgi:hypothetical protein